MAHGTRYPGMFILVVDMDDGNTWEGAPNRIRGGRNSAMDATVQ